MFSMFKEAYQSVKAFYETYREIFNRNFNISFVYSRTNTYSTRNENTAKMSNSGQLTIEHGKLLLWIHLIELRIPLNYSLIYLSFFFTCKIVRISPNLIVVECALFTQRARVRSPVRTSFLECQEALGPQGPRISFGHHNHPSSFHYGRQWP